MSELTKLAQKQKLVCAGVVFRDEQQLAVE